MTNNFAAIATAVLLPDGVRHMPGYFDLAGQRALLAAIGASMRDAPLFTPTMPRTGRPFSVRMTNCGTLGWLSDKAGGYRYEPRHPETGQPWPPIPDALLRLWADVAAAAPVPEACLVNYYADGAKMGLHVDRDEDEVAAPIVSVSLGDRARFAVGGLRRTDKPLAIELRSGDVLVMGGPARLIHHGITRVYAGSSALLPQGGRINLTLRRVTRA